MVDPRFVTNAQGERVGVILDLATCEQMLADQDDPDLLSGLSQVELAALAESELAPGHQQSLQDLQEKSGARVLSDDEAKQLDHLLDSTIY